ncbi:MAG: SAM-dependent chlorinase/fluorinase [Cyanobacteria bacterium P01_F01_bin.150]
MAPLVTLLTDFGLTDAYVGIMKGGIMAIAPNVSIIDLTHDIPPQDLWAARFNLLNAIPYFPDGTIHVAVVDPGVGGDRRAVAIQLPDCMLVGPDNGIFSAVVAPYLAEGRSLDKQETGAGKKLKAVALTNTAYWRTDRPSTTFHGRDIFAPVAAHLAQGVPVETMGNTINPNSLKMLTLPKIWTQGNEVIGCVQYGDRFGNLITNIKGQAVKAQKWQVDISGQRLIGQQTYGSVKQGDPVALIGSHGWVEIAVNGGSAKNMFGVDIGSRIKIVMEK